MERNKRDFVKYFARNGVQGRMQGLMGKDLDLLANSLMVMDSLRKEGMELTPEKIKDELQYHSQFDYGFLARLGFNKQPFFRPGKPIYTLTINDYFRIIPAYHPLPRAIRYLKDFDGSLSDALVVAGSMYLIGSTHANNDVAAKIMMGTGLASIAVGLGLKVPRLMDYFGINLSPKKKKKFESMKKQTLEDLTFLDQNFEKIF